MRLRSTLLTLLLATTATVVGLATAGPAQAAPAVSATTAADCTTSRLNLTLTNSGPSTETFTVTWAGRTGSPWTRTVAAGASSTLYWTLNPSTAYSITTTTVSGFSTTRSGLFGCGTGMSALVSYDCTQGRLQLVLENRTTVSRAFTVAWPGRVNSPWVTTVAAGGNYTHYWTVPTGTVYTLRTTADGFDDTATGTTGCRLAAGTPQMTTTTLMTTSTVIKGLNGTDATARSVRIPAMAVTNNGTVLAVADARVDGAYDLGGGTNNIQMAMTRSTDGGVTWQQPYVVRRPATTSEGEGDASFLVDRTTGTVFLIYNYSPRPGVGFYSAGTGSNSPTDTGSLHVRYIKSSDNGATWSVPVDLNPSVKNPAWQQLFASSGHGIQLSNGRLVQPIVYRDSAGTTHAANIYSDDHGATWRSGGSAGTNVNESKAVERSTGAVVQDMRHNSNRNRYFATSSDGGNTFGAATANTTLIDPLCNADQLSYLRPVAGAPARTATMLFSNNASSSARSNLTVRLSTDDGATWPARALIKPGAAGYSTMAVLGDGTAANLYEVGGTGGIYFTRFGLGWLRAA
ncbi:exo-alpha-sialidase [Actinoplanes sp. NPDC023801]|uniref:exo-alpha-sialidase n=1 Tax=Actinoplanes sp. NPDC023801 TaxID=3154595 RepID=UPI0033D2BF41